MMSGVGCRWEDGGWGGRDGRVIVKLRSLGSDYYHCCNTHFTRTGRIRCCNYHPAPASRAAEPLILFLLILASMLLLVNEQVEFWLLVSHIICGRQQIMVFEEEDENCCLAAWFEEEEEAEKVSSFCSTTFSFFV
ncbi:hypothetical protein D8674_020092 [Pyrus ussuriensis x Pyrus communis]|uniref:Uncharacterized protein n=1 Tax=Pyrus ussuriensis x Pyrus communis TaxID=2448454 RepID=A0A5N5HSZ1_9ROSA|nr:hypothetical protein D8674_020092 [Pyrus ussuriensis x Pyrus communis]